MPASQRCVLFVGRSCTVSFGNIRKAALYPLKPVLWLNHGWFAGTVKALSEQKRVEWWWCGRAPPTKRLGSEGAFPTIPPLKSPVIKSLTALQHELFSR